MPALLVEGKCILKIIGVRNTRSITDRYNASVIHPLQAKALSNPKRSLRQGEKVTVKFRREGNEPEYYLNKEAQFDGLDNDIQILGDNDAVQINRSGATHTTPESLLKKINVPETLPPIQKEPPMKEVYQLLKVKKQIILQGAPGVGKTYTTKELAVKIINNNDGHLSREDIIAQYKRAVENSRIVFSAFHQSMDYEDFIEGYKPSMDNSFTLQPGPFKTVCRKAALDEINNYVLIIDEINRGNVSKIFGELITLLETDKRAGEQEEVKMQLTYSKDNFSVPPNLFIIATMNTADRSLGQIDYALRRRFAFYTITSDRKQIETFYKNKGETQDNEAVKGKALKLFDDINGFLEKDNVVINDIDKGDIMVGHSYFMAKNEQELAYKVNFEIYPLLEEYRKDGIINAKKEDIKLLLEINDE
jgi:5-methylcytosine-specific restriction endonuclease McrBC GTP-binding regulatory subunit McrB